MLSSCCLFEVLQPGDPFLPVPSLPEAQSPAATHGLDSAVCATHVGAWGRGLGSP